MAVLKSSEEITALINRIIELQGWKIRPLRNGSEWKAERTAQGVADDKKWLAERAAQGFTNGMLISYATFRTRPAAVRHLVHERGVRGLSQWMAEVEGNLVEVKEQDLCISASE